MLFHLLLLSCLLAAAGAAECNNVATPGPPNNETTVTDAPTLVRTSAHGKLFTVG